MKENYQIPGKQTIWEHGLSVKSYSWDLINYIKYGIPLKYKWRLPDWIETEKKYLKKHLNRFSKQTIDMYTLYHDCGKPFYQEYINNPRITFHGEKPGHSEVSSIYFRSVFGYYSKHHISELIRYDMKIHTMKTEDINWMIKRQEMILWIIVGLAEVHSNAELFGGMESTSFKIKWKQVARRGCQLIDKKKLSIYD